MTEEELSKIVSSELDSAITWMDADLADQQASNLEYYYGEPFGNELEGFSSVVTRDVMEGVEGIMPELMKIFTSGDNVVEFEPHGPEDVEQASQETDYLNYIFQRRCDGFSVLYTWFKDALLMRNGIVKIGWTEEDSREVIHFSDMTQDEIDDLEDDDELEITDTEEQEPINPEAEEAPDYEQLFRVKAIRYAKKGRPYVACIPSEEFRIRERSSSIKDTSFVAHVTPKTVGEVIELGYDEDDVSFAAHYESSEVADARFSDPHEGTSTSIGHEHEVQLIDAYVKVFDEDTKQVKLYNVIQIGNTVLEHKEVDVVPFISLSPIIVPHKFIGVSIADLLRDIQEIRSQLYRNTLDNLALANAGRYAVLENQVNLQDLIDNKIGGIVREKTPGAVRQLPTPQLGNATFPFLQELEQEKEDRTGVSKMTQGLDPNALTSNTAATAVNQIMTAAQQKILLIARIFAETGVKELFLHLHRQARTHQVKEDIVRLRGTFVPVTPFEWSDRYDMTVTVGIGNGNKDQQLFHLTNITNVLREVGNTQFGYLISAEHVYNLVAQYIKNAGYKNVDTFIADPKTVQPPEPQPSAEMIKAQNDSQELQLKAQMQQTTAQMEQAKQQLDQARFQLEQAQFDWKKRIEAAEISVEASQGRPVGIGK